MHAQEKKEDILVAQTRGGGTWQSLIRGGSAPRSNPLPFLAPSNV